MRALLSPFVRQRLVMLAASEDGADLATLTEVIERGGVRPALERTFPLEEAGAAIDHVASGRARGKVVVSRHRLSDARASRAGVAARAGCSGR